ncbi:hypothetical protein [Ectothiorhodospira shaposhnikovii]|uniref:hypothetical protein n=1 Tax=Ectothiorhodospira shaposhnikovii TaxID=1054 RepID=UPI001EE7946F|nr:hypothetical protein [Ectothiorhodospira shaposhnikovii]MCG5511954.1 hypothetical protein [Ectothiorhodospira shaposhnikovii]
MTPSDDSALVRLGLRARNTHTGDTDHDTRISVYDGHGMLVAREAGLLSVTLARGLYTLRTERLGEMGEDRVILLDRDLEMTLSSPRRHSAMPSADTAHTHEFLQAVSMRYSRESSCEVPGALDDDPRLMVLVRATGDQDHSDSFPAGTLSLIREDGSVVTRFEPENTQRNQREGWVVFSARLHPGNYILTDIHEGRAVSLPVLLNGGWDTFVFVPFEGVPQLAASSIDMRRRGEGYDPGDRFTQEIDAALQGLGSRLNLLSDVLLKEAIFGKFRHPFHGMVGAYAHLLGGRRSERLERDILRNLWHLLEGSTDVIALLLLALEREPDGIPDSLGELDAVAGEIFGMSITDQLPLGFPPMLRSGLDSLIHASVKLPELIAPNSWLETAANASYSEGAWAVWEQVAAMPSQQKLYSVVKRALAGAGRRAVHTIYADDRINSIVGTDRGLISGIVADIARDLKDYVVHVDPSIIQGDTNVRELVLSVARAAQPRQDSPHNLCPDNRIPDWLVTLVRERCRREGKHFDPRKLARMAGVPLKSVERVMTRPSAD